MNSSLLKSGQRLLEQKQYPDVYALAIDAIKRDVNDPAPYLLLARIAGDHGNREKAVELFDRACDLDRRQAQPAKAIYPASYAQYLTTVGQHEQAVSLIGDIDAEDIADSYVADLIGVILSRLGLHSRAVAFFSRAVELNPRPGNYHYNLGASLQFSGDFTAAESAYRACIDREPEAFRAYTALVSLKKQRPDDNWLAGLMPLFDKASDPDARLHIGHAIAKTHEDLGSFDESLNWLGRAKAAKRESLDYHLHEDLALFVAAKETVAAPPSTDHTRLPAPPIFIVGLPRTGTTLVDRILSSHSQVVSAGELNTFAGIIKEQTATAFNRVLDTDTLRQSRGLDLGNVADIYLQRVRHLVGDSPRFTDKMPLNFFYVGLILRAIPSARVVVLRRNPMDSCLSNYRQLFSTGFSYYNYSLDLKDTADYFRAFDDLMTFWRTQLPAERVAEFSYEDLVCEQETSTRRLLAFCGLEWEPGCLDFHANTAPVSTASSVQVRQPLYRSAMGRWRRYGAGLDDLSERLKDLSGP